MKLLRVLLRDVETGKEAWYEDDYADDYPEDSIDFLWTEGNYACDCNRGVFMARVSGEPEPDLSCAGERIKIVQATINGQPFPVIVDPLALST